jgi:hypothetical protein
MMAAEKDGKPRAGEDLAAQVRQAAGARAGDVQEADRLARLIASQLQEVGPAKAASLHRLGQANLARIFNEGR